VFGYSGVVVGLFCFNCLSSQSTHETMDHVKQNLSRDLQPQFHTTPSHYAVNLPARMHENVIKKKLNIVKRFNHNRQFILVHAVVLFANVFSLKMYKSIAVVTHACQGRRKERRFRERNFGLFFCSYGELSSRFWYFFATQLVYSFGFFILTREN